MYSLRSKCTPLTQQYISISAAQQQVCMPYMTPFSAFDPPTHYSILYISLWKTLTTELLPWLQTSWGDSGHEKVIEVIFPVQSRIPAQHELGCQWNLLHTYTKKGRYSGYILLMNSDIDVPGQHSFVVTCDWEVVHYKKAIVILTSHLLFEFKMSKHHVGKETSGNRLFKNSKTHCCNWHSWLIVCDANGKVQFGWRCDCCNVLWTLKQSVTELAVHAWVWFLACLLQIACDANG